MVTNLDLILNGNLCVCLISCCLFCDAGGRSVASPINVNSINPSHLSPPPPSSAKELRDDPGKYKLLGSGGCGSVYLARYLGSRVAVKILSFGSDEGSGLDEQKQKERARTANRMDLFIFIAISFTE